jgi:hypothetical protein
MQLQKVTSRKSRKFFYSCHLEEERMQWLEEKNLSEGKVREREDRWREERMRILEQRLEDQEKERQVRETVIYEALANLKERMGGGEDRRGGEWKGRGQ